MAKAKRKTLPKDFQELLEKCDLETLKRIFDGCDVNSRGGSLQQSALAFNECPDDLARWLVEQGADISAEDRYGETPLHARAGHWRGRIEVLLELGADVHSGENGRGTPLHKAAATGNLHTARLLLERGARADAVNSSLQTPLVYALQRCNNAKIKGTAAMAELFMGGARSKSPGVAPVTPEMRALVRRIGTDFEFHRDNFNPSLLEETNAALEKLYALFDVPPVPHRKMHDDKSPIIAKAQRWEDQHQELWELLVPSSGPCKSVQGEVIRISGRIRLEIENNGGANWDAAYQKMADAFLKHLASGVPLPGSALDEARKIVAELKSQRGDTARMCAWAVEWVALNPAPTKLPTPDYKR